MNRLKNNFIRIALCSGALLLIPLVLQLTIGTGIDGQGFNWGLGDFVFAFVLICGVASLFELARRRAEGSTAYKTAAALALAGIFLLIWVNAAVGIIGDDGNVANALYFAVIAAGFFGTILAGLKPAGMARTLFTMAAVQMLVPIIAFVVWRPVVEEAPGIVGVFILNAFFAMLFTGSALLFRRVSVEQGGSV